MTTLFANAVKLRGFLGCDANVPASNGIKDESFAVLTLCVESGDWNKVTNEWLPQTAWHRIVCPGPFFCGFTRGMKQGDFIEIEGELHIPCFDPPIIIANKMITDRRPAYEVRATQIRRLEYPPIGIHKSDGG